MRSSDLYFEKLCFKLLHTSATSNYCFYAEQSQSVKIQIAYVCYIFVLSPLFDVRLVMLN